MCLKHIKEVYQISMIYAILKSEYKNKKKLYENRKPFLLLWYTENISNTVMQKKMAA